MDATLLLRRRKKIISGSRGGEEEESKMVADSDTGGDEEECMEGREFERRCVVGQNKLEGATRKSQMPGNQEVPRTQQG